MEISSVIGLAQIKAEWLSARQIQLAQNVANVNSPGYKSTDLVSFNEVLNNLNLTNPMNDASGARMNFQDAFKTVATPAEDTSMSQNSVSIETELLKMSETASQYSLTTNIIKSFHRMISASLKG